MGTSVGTPWTHTQAIRASSMMGWGVGYVSLSTDPSPASPVASARLTKQKARVLWAGGALSVWGVVLLLPLVFSGGVLWGLVRVLPPPHYDFKALAAVDYHALGGGNKGGGREGPKPSHHEAKPKLGERHYSFATTEEEVVVMRPDNASAAGEEEEIKGEERKAGKKEEEIREEGEGGTRAEPSEVGATEEEERAEEIEEEGREEGEGREEINEGEREEEEGEGSQEAHGGETIPIAEDIASNPNPKPEEEGGESKSEPNPKPNVKEGEEEGGEWWGGSVGPEELKALREVEGGLVREGRGEGPFGRYLAQGGSLPMVLLTCNRAELLDQTLASLRQVQGVSVSKQLLVSQDGGLQAIADVATKHQVTLAQNKGGVNLRGGVPRDGASRIALHYKYSLTQAFEHFPDAPGVLVLEDDLLFSPDFLDYFHSNAPLLDIDKTTFILSAWNDNGFASLIQDKHRLMRSEFFPGLGWLCPRRLWEEELRDNWPRQHWDHWLRSRDRHRGRDCVYPEVPRTYHNGVKGTFMDTDTHNRYFAHIGYNQDPSVKWPAPSPPHPHPPSLLRASIQAYDARLRDELSRGLHKGREGGGGKEGLMQALLAVREEGQEEGKALVLWHEVTVGEGGFEIIGKAMGIWHEEKRGGYRGVHELSSPHLQRRLYLINAQDSPFAHSHKPVGVVPFGASHFQYLLERGGLSGLSKHSLNSLSPTLPQHWSIHPAKSAGLSCHDVCTAQGLVCDARGLVTINSCASLQKAFPSLCVQCRESYGLEQPAYVLPSAPLESLPGSCLYSSLSPHPPTCRASHPLTRRLCACAPTTAVQ